MNFLPQKSLEYFKEETLEFEVEIVDPKDMECKVKELDHLHKNIQVQVTSIILKIKSSLEV
jgi:hypothetical protein